MGPGEVLPLLGLALPERPGECPETEPQRGAEPMTPPRAARPRLSAPSPFSSFAAESTLTRYSEVSRGALPMVALRWFVLTSWKPISYVQGPGRSLSGVGAIRALVPMTPPCTRGLGNRLDDPHRLGVGAAAAGSGLTMNSEVSRADLPIVGRGDATRELGFAL